MAHIAIIDYGAGNLHSVEAGFKRVIDNSTDTLAIVNSSDALDDATHIVLPGVGAYADCLNALKACDGMIDAMHTQAYDNKTPFLGICVGMQMLMQRGHEHGTHEGLGWFDGDVIALESSNPAIKVPHMGWNELSLHHSHAALAHVENGHHAYFVHSYHARCTNPSDILATTSHGSNIVAMIGRDNIIGTQFHPEKSQQLGAQILENFVIMR